MERAFQMHIDVQAGQLKDSPSKAIIVTLFQGEDKESGQLAEFDSALDGAISRLSEERDIAGRRQEITLIHTFGRLPSPRVLVLGLGKRPDFDGPTLRNALAVAARYLRRAGAESIAMSADPSLGLSPEECAQAIVEGTSLGLYRYLVHKKEPEDKREVQELVLVEPDASRIEAVRLGAERGRVGAEATVWARDLANEPSNFLTPSELAERARRVADEHGLEFEVLERDQMREMGMGALLGVAQGSQQPPKLIVLKYRGGAPEGKALGLVGKGITFDSGGISIKPSQGMEDMKADMAGGAAVIATVGALAELKAKLNVTAIVPATENMPGGSAQRPGDVVKAMNGKTIEVINTDAEGRLILADALCYARKLGLSPVVDVATLTGAMSITLGKVAFGAMTNSEPVLDRVREAAKAAGEKVWELPLFKDYMEKLDSEVADIKNTGGREAGSITAALFLKEFIEDTPWVHLDIAGVDQHTEVKGIFLKGSSGTVVRTLINLGLNLAEKPLPD
jgi:leucyl aminopeptidase